MCAAHDFTGDGRPDIAALYSQEYEEVDLFENRLGQPGGAAGTGWVRSPAWSAGPDFWLHGIELVDLNNDGRMDVLATNGDAFDNSYVTPWHGVQWLENRGELPFVAHRLTDMPGAYRAKAGDFDRDGDLDIIAVSRLPENPYPRNLPLPAASIVLLLQNDAGEFERHTLETGAPHYPTVEVGDFDGNGCLDFAVASGPYSATGREGRREVLSAPGLVEQWGRSVTMHHHQQPPVASRPRIEIRGDPLVQENKNARRGLTLRARYVSSSTVFHPDLPDGDLRTHRLLHRPAGCRELPTHRRDWVNCRGRFRGRQVAGVDVFADEADGTVGHQGMHTTGVVAAGRQREIVVILVHVRTRGAAGRVGRQHRAERHSL